MKIIVPIKQVPETSNVKMDPETGTMLRTSVEAVVNPLDLFAIEAALCLRERYGGEVTTISMGPPRAEEALREALAMGCDQAVLLSNKQFGGSDTWATAYVLSLAIQKLQPYDLVVCGERATDGETGQVGPEIAAYLDHPLGTFVSKIIEVNEDSARIERIVEGGRDILSTSLPLVVAVVKEIGVPRFPTVRAKMKAKKIEIPVWGPQDIGAKPEWIGLKGSSTRVIKIAAPQLMRKGEIFAVQNSEDLEEACDRFIQFLNERELTTDISKNSRE